jgi:hypothetical protein
MLDRVLPRFGIKDLPEDVSRSLNLAWHRLDAMHLTGARSRAGLQAVASYCASRISGQGGEEVSIPGQMDCIHEPIGFEHCRQIRLPKLEGIEPVPRPTGTT